MEPFLLLADDSVNPFLPGTRDKWFISNNIAVEFRGKTISEQFDGAFFIKSHSRESGQSFKLGNVLIDFTALHADFFDILFGTLFAHCVREGVFESVVDSDPKPFVCYLGSSPGLGQKPLDLSSDPLVYGGPLIYEKKSMARVKGVSITSVLQLRPL